MALPLAAALLLGVHRGCVEFIATGFTTVTLTVIILDADTDQPLPDARVQLRGDGPADAALIEAEGTTRPDGRATLSLRVMWDEHRDNWGRLRSKSVNYGPWLLSVTCEGYRGREEPLPVLTRAPSYHYGANPPPIVIRLFPGTEADTPR